MIKKQTFEILNKNGDTMKSFLDFGQSVNEFTKHNPNYVRLVQRQTIERELYVRQVNTRGNAEFK